MIQVNMETKDGVILNTNGKYCEDYIQVTPINADAISAQNIKEGVTILGVEGTLEPSNIDQLISGEITTLNIPNNTTKIREYAFYNCYSLTSAIIANSVTSIGRSAFNGCRNLISIVLSKNLTTIDTAAFNICSSLTSIKLSNNITTIGDNVFHSCFGLTDVIIENGFNANNLDLSASTKYTHDTILSWLNALYDRTGLDAYRLIIGSTNLQKLTDEEKAIATNKNWTLA